MSLIQHKMSLNPTVLNIFGDLLARHACLLDKLRSGPRKLDTRLSGLTAVL